QIDKIDCETSPTRATKGGPLFDKIGQCRPPILASLDSSRPIKAVPSFRTELASP
ncbi:hypothetical protein LINPERHAP1_LOCUS12990, partial [Linum perenne]